MAIRFDTLEELEEFCIRFAELLKAGRPMTNAERCKKYRDSKKTVSENVESVSNDTTNVTTEEERKEEGFSPSFPSSLSSPLIPPINPITPIIPSSQEEKREEGTNKKGGRGELKPFGEFVRLSDAEYQRLVQDFGYEKTERMIEAMNNYIGEDETGKLARKYSTRNHNLTLRNWENRRAEESRQPKAKVSLPGKSKSFYDIAVEMNGGTVNAEDGVIDL